MKLNYIYSQHQFLTDTHDSWCVIYKKDTTHLRFIATVFRNDKHMESYHTRVASRTHAEVLIRKQLMN